MFSVRLKKSSARVCWRRPWPRSARRRRPPKRARARRPRRTVPLSEQFEISASFGLGQRSNPVDGRSDIPLVVIPHISWYGKRFFLENLEARLHAATTAKRTRST